MIHEARGTGGSTFAPEFKQVADRGRIVLAISDSDKRHPGGGFGDTYSKLQTAARGCPGYQRVRAIHTRTAEGLVPPAVYRDVFGFPHDQGDPRMGVIARIEQFLRSAPSNVTSYANFKNGITLYEVEHPKTEEEGSYWRDVAEKTGRDRCIWSKHDQCVKREECRCHVVDGLGDKVLANVVSWMKARKSKKELASRIALSQDSELSALADEVLAWGLAFSPVMT